MAEVAGVEPTITESKSAVIPFHHTSIYISEVGDRLESNQQVYPRLFSRIELHRHYPTLSILVYYPHIQDTKINALYNPLLYAFYYVCFAVCVFVFKLISSYRNFTYRNKGWVRVCIHFQQSNNPLWTNLI